MKKKLLSFIFLIGAPLTLMASVWLKFIKKRGIGKVNDKILMFVGMLPLIDNYYEPLINPKKYLINSLRKDRKLNGIDFNIDEQLKLIENFKFNQELVHFPVEKNENFK